MSQSSDEDQLEALLKASVQRARGPKVMVRMFSGFTRVFEAGELKFNPMDCPEIEMTCMLEDGQLCIVGARRQMVCYESFGPTLAFYRQVEQRPWTHEEAEGA